MNDGKSLLGGIGIGMGLMYILDPSRGRRRRALARDQMIHALRVLTGAVDVGLRDMRNRTLGLGAELMARTAPDEATDDVLTARIRSKMGRLVSHPGMIQVSVEQGNVTLSGAILAGEMRPLLDCVSGIRGVRSLRNLLQSHRSPGGHAAAPLRQTERWTPSARLAAGLAGTTLLGYGLGRGGLLGTGAGCLGAGLLMRTAANREMRRLLGADGGRRNIEIRKSINIAAPVEQVFEFWDDFENFPFFMRNVKKVVDRGNGRSHWTVAGPAGMDVDWEAELTQRVENQLIAWKSVSGAIVGNAGIVRFCSNPDGSTRVDVRLSYNPPAGAIGHALAALLGSDPKTEMDQDLVRMKTMIETGRQPHDAHTSNGRMMEMARH